MFATFAVAECPRHKVKDLVSKRLTLKWDTFLKVIAEKLDRLNRVENVNKIPSETFRVEVYDELKCWFNHPNEYKKATFVHMAKYIERVRELETLCVTWMTQRRAAVWKMGDGMGGTEPTREYENMHGVLFMCKAAISHVFSHEKRTYMLDYANAQSEGEYDSKSILYNSWERFDPILVMLLRMYKLAYVFRKIAEGSFSEDQPRSRERYQRDAQRQTWRWYPVSDDPNVNKFDMSVDEISAAISSAMDTVSKNAEKEYVRTQPHLKDVVTVLTWVDNKREIDGGHYERMYGTVVAESTDKVRIKWKNNNRRTEWGNVVPRTTEHKRYSGDPKNNIRFSGWALYTAVSVFYERLYVDFAPENRNYTWWTGRVPYVEITPAKLCSMDITTLGLDQCRQLVLDIKKDDILVHRREQSYRLWLREHCENERDIQEEAQAREKEEKRNREFRVSKRNRRFSLN